MPLASRNFFEIVPWVSTRHGGATLASLAGPLDRWRRRFRKGLSPAQTKLSRSGSAPSRQRSAEGGRGQLLTCEGLSIDRIDGDRCPGVDAISEDVGSER